MSEIVDYYGQSHAMPGPYRDTDHVKAANVMADGHFFDRDTLRFFGSRIAPGVIGGRLFITSEQDTSPYVAPEDRPWQGARRYTVRIMDDNGSVQPCGPVTDDEDSTFGAFADLRTARRWAESYAAGDTVSAIATWVTARQV